MAMAAGDSHIHDQPCNKWGGIGYGCSTSRMLEDCLALEANNSPCSGSARPFDMMIIGSEAVLFWYLIIGTDLLLENIDC